MPLSKQKEKLIQRLRSSRARSREGFFLAEGIRCAGEFLEPGIILDVRFAVVSPRLGALEGGEELLARLEASAIPVERAEDIELARVSDMETPQGILLVVQEPVVGESLLKEMDQPRLLLLDGIQDPGNVGTLVRGARAFGLDGVVALDGTADPWGPRAVRASAGALARIPVIRGSVSRILPRLMTLDVPLLAAEAGGRDVREVRLEEGWILALGNEGAGIRPQIREAAHQILSIAMAPGMDSLNVAVAGSVLLFALGAPALGQDSRSHGSDKEPL